MKPINKAIFTTFLTLTLLVGCSNSNDAEQANAFVDRSIAYERQGQYRAALIEMRNAIQASPGDADFVNRYAEILISVGQPNQAADLLLGLDNLSDRSKAILAEAQLLQGKYISAKEQLFGLAASSDLPEETIKRLNAVQQYLSGNQTAALNSLRKLSELPETTLDSKIDFITLLLQSNEYEEASQWVNLLLSQFPENAELLYFSAQLARLGGDLEQSESQLTSALINLPETDMLLNERLQVLELLSTVLTELGRPDEALVYSKIIREANPEAFLAKQQYKDALAAASTGDLNSAKAAFEDILNQFPNNQQAALLLGLIHLEEGDLDSGEALLTENIDAETAPVSIVRATALAQAEQGKAAEALSVLEKALLAKPDDITLLSLYGVISLNNNEDQQGLQSISKALQLAPGQTRLHLLLAQYYSDNKQDDVALGHLRKAYSQNPEDWPTTGFYLNKLLENEEIAEATRVRNEISRSYADRDSALWLLSLADYQLGNTGSALNNLEKLYKRAPENLNVVNALGRMYQQTEKFEAASQMWLNAIQINPGNVGFVRALVETKSKSLTQVELADWFMKAAEDNPEIALPLHSAAVELLVVQNRLDDAESIGKKYSNNGQPIAKTIEANVLRGKALKAASEQTWNKATDHAEKALAIFPNNRGLILLAARLNMDAGTPENAIEILTQAIETNPNNPFYINEKAKTLNVVQSTRAALEFMQPIWNERPNGAFAQTYFGLVNLENPENLETAVNELLEVEPNNTGALTTLGSLKLSAGDQAEAIKYYEKAIEINDRLVPALNNLAWLTKETRPREALRWAERAAELAPNSASVLDTYGWLLHLNGEKNNAIKVLDRALELEPENDEIKQHRAAVS